MIIVVSDTSPIRALHHLGLLSVLGKLYDRVVIPPAVRDELISPPRQFPQIDLSGFGFVEFRAPQNVSQVNLFLQQLDRGEAEALALALELQVKTLLIDELAGRNVAEQNGIRPLGSLGILLDAKASGHLAEVRPLMDKLIHDLGFFVSDELRQHVLKLAGE